MIHLWHAPFVLLLGAAVSAMFFIPDFGSVDDRAPTIGSLFRFFGVPEMRADKAMPIFLAGWGLTGLGLNALGIFYLDPYPLWFVLNALVSGLLLGVGAVAVYAKLRGVGASSDEPPGAG